VPVLQTMTKDMDDQNVNNEEILELDDFCEECKILTGFKICYSCKTSKTIFPI